jgi:hypothetical protein
VAECLHEAEDVQHEGVRLREDRMKEEEDEVLVVEVTHAVIDPWT